MSKTHALALMVVGTLVGGYALLTPGRADPAAPPAGGGPAGGGSRANVAVVNMQQVFKGSEEVKSLTEEFDKADKAAKAETEKRTTELTKKEEDLRANFQPDSKEFKERSKELLQERVAFRVTLEEQRRSSVQQQQRRTIAFYEKVTQAVKAIAVEDGLDLVLYKEEFQLKTARSPEELLEMIRQKKVIFESPRAEITQKVIDRLNSELVLPPH